jgi:hypothetical protein
MTDHVHDDLCVCGAKRKPQKGGGPTGTISLIGATSTGIEPLYSQRYARRLNFYPAMVANLPKDAAIAWIDMEHRMSPEEMEKLGVITKEEVAESYEAIAKIADSVLPGSKRLIVMDSVSEKEPET